MNVRKLTNRLLLLFVVRVCFSMSHPLTHYTHTSAKLCAVRGCEYTATSAYIIQFSRKYRGQQAAACIFRALNSHCENFTRRSRDCMRVHGQTHTISARQPARPQQPPPPPPHPSERAVNASDTLLPPLLPLLPAWQSCGACKYVCAIYYSLLCAATATAPCYVLRTTVAVV